MLIRPFVKKHILTGLLGRRSKPSLRQPQEPDILFDGNDQLFKQTIAGAQVYGEYGVGKSTVWVHANTQCPILAVDTDLTWIETVKAEIGVGHRLNVKWIDLGEVGDWGRPKTYAKRDRFRDYVQSIWSRDQSPDLVLIDGRFRVCCFLTTLARARPGTVILFDDYVERPHYHVVEEYLKPDRLCGRQAQFTVPDFVDHIKVEQTAAQFLYVMD